MGEKISTRYEPVLGTILVAASTAKSRNGEGKILTGNKILTIESAHFIWKIRFQRVISNFQITRSHTRNPEEMGMIDRLSMDQA